MGEKVLVAYASRTGSTGGIAEAIGQRLCDAGLSVDVRQAKDVADLGPYRAVVVGSAAYVNNWMSHAVKFVQRNREALSRMPVAFFTGCLTMQEDTEENRRKSAEFSQSVRELVAPAAEGYFAGALDPKKLPLHFRLIIKALGQKAGDYRDWEAIRTWTDEALLPLLQ